MRSKPCATNLIAYGGGLAEKSQIIALNKIDALTDDEIEDKRSLIANAAKIAADDIFAISGVSGAGFTGTSRQIIIIGPWRPPG